MYRQLAISVLVFGSLCASALGAPTRCECEYDKWVGDCKAAISRTKNWVRITSNTQQCSRVDWYINGHPRLTVVTDGVSSEEILNFQDDAKIAIQSCKVCMDAMLSGSGQAPPAASGEATAAPSASPFAGTWIGTEKNIFGFAHTIDVRLEVLGSTLSGTWHTSNSPRVSRVTGTVVSATEAKVSIEGGSPFGNTLRLADPSTLNYSFPPFGSGTLRKE